MSFAALKKQGSLLDKLNKEINKTEVTSGFIDDRLWKPQMGKEGIGSAVIRFLPPAKGNELPWAKVWSHAFQGPGGWYIENSLTPLGLDSDKEIARKQKRKLSYYSNIYVIKDAASPENEGRVFLYKYGKKIHDKIIAAMQPEFEGEEPINPFDFWQGADFNLRIKKVAGYWNYDSSTFGSVSPLGGFDDAKLESIYNQIHDLNEFTGASNFKTYDELKTRLDLVLKGTATRRVDEEELENEIAAKMESKPSPSVASPSIATPSSTNPDEDAFSYFDQLANDEF